MERDEMDRICGSRIHDNGLCAKKHDCETCGKRMDCFEENRSQPANKDKRVERCTVVCQWVPKARREGE